MRIWLIGADQAGERRPCANCRRTPGRQVIVSDTIARPKAVADHVIARVDYVEQVTSANVNQLARRVRPDLILLDASAGQPQLIEGEVSGGTSFWQRRWHRSKSFRQLMCHALSLSRREL